MMEIAILPSNIIRGLNTAIKNNFGITNIVFDPQSSYLSSMQNIRDTALLLNRVNSGPIANLRADTPCLSWNRGPLTSYAATRSLRFDQNGIPGNGATGQFTYNFMFLTTNIIDLEKFELKYLAKTGINSITGIIVDLGADLGKFEYSITFDPVLNNIDFSKEINVNQAVSGSAVITGSFFSLDESVDPPSIITDIEFSLDSTCGIITSSLFSLLGDNND